MSDRILKALLRQPVDRTPAWIMRQAGRYLPEYREVRSKAKSFLTLCKTPELACKVTLQPLSRYDLDAAILFSDILTIPDAMGVGVQFDTGHGPIISNPIRTQRDVAAIGLPDPEQDLKYVMDTIRLLRQELNSTPLIGFAGSPWTVATYMVEGGVSKNFSQIKSMLYNDAKLLHQLLDILSDATSLYLNAQIKAGAQVVMIFDSWGGVLTPDKYQEFSLQYISKIFSNLIREHDGHIIPRIIYAKGCNHSLAELADSGCDAIGIDWTINIGDARKIVGDKVALQGNLDPCVLYGSPDIIQKEVSKVLNSYGEGTGHIFNLGHGIYPDVPIENVEIMLKAVRD